MFKKRNLIFLSLLILGVFLITGCWLISTPTYTVTFDSQGGSAVDPQTVERGGLVIEPTAPTWTGYAFAGWYKELECTNAWDFNTDTVTSDVTLYARWATNTYTVTFDKNGGDTEANPKTKTAEHGGNVGTLPTAPTRTGYTFTSWNTKAIGSGTKFKATTAVTADITVYAQWTINTYSVTFDSQGGSAVASQNVNHGGQVTEPTAPTWTGYTFGGWYEELECINAWDFDTDTVISDVTLYAKWMGSVHNTTQVTYYTAIQPALNAAATGDIIEVNDGTYAESITFPNGMLITLKSVNGASSTFITGDNDSATVICVDSLQGTTLEGFTITHNSGYTGKGITIAVGYLTINNCTLAITGSTISGNSTESAFWDGGGIYNEQGTVIITSSTISGNSSANYAGGIHNRSGTLTITSSTISGNSSAADGGGIYNEHGTVIITGSTISGNSSATYGGGGIYNEDILRYGTLTITGSTISGNTATNSDGGGIYNGLGTSTITSSIISSNSAASGGGIYIYDNLPTSTQTIQNNTISGNTASVSGGGIYIEIGSPTIGGANESDTGNFNTICGNTLNQIDPNPVAYPNNYIFTNCDVIGEIGPAEGLIFYDKGSVSDGWRYLEAAPSDQSEGAQWGCYGTGIPDAGGTAVGTGDQNTEAILLGCATAGIAARLCTSYNGGGFTDWFLPSKDELNLMYENLHYIGTPVGGFAGGPYWSSSEGGVGSAWYQYFSDGDQTLATKVQAVLVRAVRAF
jgi:uncharacterized repeat protein (TIGR02543 family)